MAVGRPPHPETERVTAILRTVLDHDERTTLAEAWAQVQAAGLEIPHHSVRRIWDRYLADAGLDTEELVQARLDRAAKMRTEKLVAQNKPIGRPITDGTAPTEPRKARVADAIRRHLGETPDLTGKEVRALVEAEGVEVSSDSAWYHVWSDVLNDLGLANDRAAKSRRERAALKREAARREANGTPEPKRARKAKPPHAENAEIRAGSAAPYTLVALADGRCRVTVDATLPAVVALRVMAVLAEAA